MKIQTLLPLGLLICSLVGHSTVIGAEPRIEHAPLSPDLVTVPQNLLNLIHAQEVQADLQMTEDQILQLESLLRQIDSQWWPGRIRPALDQRKLVSELESKLIDGLASISGPKGVNRLRQIELQSQGVRMLSRPEVQKFLQLDKKQISKIEELFSEVDTLGARSAAVRGKVEQDKVKAFTDAKNTETTRALALLSPSQSEKLRTALGKTLDTAKMERIYPLAPELIDSGYWTGGNKVTLEELRGEVVLVHFYAFQCHNCVANFQHYKRWDESLKKRGVRVIGIQTPETPDEKDVKKVSNAAAKEGFAFPVLIDTDSKNWNAWGNTMWPTVYVIDKKGYIRLWWQGELNWQGATGDKKIEALVDQLLSES